jgi:hypothetical protein
MESRSRLASGSRTTSTGAEEYGGAFTSAQSRQVTRGLRRAEAVHGLELVDQMERVFAR